MKRRTAFFLLVGLLGSSTALAKVAIKRPATPRPTPAAGKILVEMIAVTLADDCADGQGKAPNKPSRGPASMVAPADRGCEQTSMQLSVIADAGAANTGLVVKKVELFDEGGALLGVLSPRSPRVWSDAGYSAWDEKVAPGQSLSVTYALSKPNIGLAKRDKTYLVKAVITVDGGEQTVQHDIRVFAQGIQRPMLPT